MYRAQLRLVFAALMIVALSSSSASAQFDGILAHCPASGSPAFYDVCLDTSDSSLWALDERDGGICHIQLSAFSPYMTDVARITHPFGAAVPPFFAVARGLAYNPINDSLLVMRGVTHELYELDQDGTVLSGPLTINADPSVNLESLTWNTLTGMLWARDTANEQLIEIDPTTATVTGVTIPIPLIGQRRYGNGLTFVDVGGVTYFDVTAGTVFSNRPDHTIRLDTNGDLTGYEADLSDIPDDVTGIVRDGDVVYALTAGFVYRTTLSVPALLPPTQVTWTTADNGDLSLTWVNNGPGGVYDSITITRAGSEILSAGAGTLTNFVDDSPGAGLTAYSISGTSGADTASANFVIMRGAGALIQYTIHQGPAQNIGDITYDSNRDFLYVSERNSKTIYVYNSDLVFFGTFQLDLASGALVRGIAYDSVNDVVFVSRASTNSLWRFQPTADPITTPWVTLGGFTTSMLQPENLTYDEINTNTIAIDINGGSPTFFAVEAEDPPVGSELGATRWTAAPPLLELGRGISFVADSSAPNGLLMASVDQGGGVTPQADIFYPVTAFSHPYFVPFYSMGETHQQAGAVAGIEDMGNKIFVANPLNGAIFKLLLSPGGSDFIRGDSDMSGTVDIGDAMHLLNYLYAGGPQPDCLDASDANDDGRLDLSDSLYLIRNLFLGSPPPPAPFPAAGPDPTFVDPLDC